MSKADPESNKKEEEEHSSPAPHVGVNQVELFGDLVFVVGLNIIAKALEAMPFLSFEGYLVFILRVYLVWYLWNQGAVALNLAQRFDDDGKFNPFDYAIGFAFLWMTALMARTIVLNDDRNFVIFYLCVRGVQSLYMFVRVYLRRECPKGIAPEVHALGRNLAIVGPMQLLFIEAAPLITMAATGHLGTDKQGDNPDWYGKGVWLGVVIVLTLINLIGAAVDDAKHDGVGVYSKLLDPHHIKERYELIVLIFLGEMVFAASGTGSFQMTACTLSVLVAGFLLYFLARPADGGKVAWSTSSKTNVIEALLHFGLFVALAGLGAAWALQIHQIGHSHHATETHGGQTWTAHQAAAGDDAMAKLHVQHKYLVGAKHMLHHEHRTHEDAATAHVRALAEHATTHLAKAATAGAAAIATKVAAAHALQPEGLPQLVAEKTVVKKSVTKSATSAKVATTEGAVKVCSCDGEDEEAVVKKQQEEEKKGGTESAEEAPPATKQKTTHGKEEALEGEDATLAHHHQTTYGDHLLCISAALFLLFSSLMSLTNGDPTGDKAPMAPGVVRFAVRAAAGVACLVGYKTLEHNIWLTSGFVVAVMLTTALVEIYLASPKLSLKETLIQIIS